MRKTISFLIGLLLLTVSVANTFAGNSDITDENIQKFIEVFPEYTEVVSKIKMPTAYKMDTNNAMSTANEMFGDVQKFFEAHNLDMISFTMLVQKIALAYSEYSTKTKLPETYKKTMNNFVNISEQEKNIVKKYMADLKQIFEDKS